MLDACAEAGIGVPEEMAVLGVDDDPIICESSVPALSSIRMGAFREIAAQCGNMNESHLAVLFKKATGLSMSDYRKQNREPPDD